VTAKSAVRRRNCGWRACFLLLTGPNGQPIHCVAVHVVDVAGFRVDVNATVHGTLVADPPMIRLGSSVLRGEGVLSVRP
jgi:hypothetical protein